MYDLALARQVACGRRGYAGLVSRHGLYRRKREYVKIGNVNLAERTQVAVIPRVAAIQRISKVQAVAASGIREVYTIRLHGSYNG